jgi:hypothetical protein
MADINFLEAGERLQSLEFRDPIGLNREDSESL